MNLHDRLTRGFLAGVAGGIAMSALNYISYLLGIVEVLYLEWASVLIFGYRPATIWEFVLAQAGQFFFAGIIGVIFAYLIPRVTSMNYLFKGWLYGLTVWFGTYAAAILFQLSPLIPIKADTAASNIVTATLYGLVLAAVLHWLDKRVEL